MEMYVNQETGQIIYARPGDVLPYGSGYWMGDGNCLYGGSTIPRPPGAPTTCYGPIKPLPRWVKLMFLGIVSFFVGAFALIAGLLQWRGNLQISRTGIRWVGMPPISTATGTIYRVSDVERVFMSRDPRSGPEYLVPNSTIGTGHFKNLDLVAPSGDLTVKGDVYGSRISVPQGTLTITGDALASTLFACHIVTLGYVVNTRETATTIENRGTIGIGNNFQHPAGGRTTQQKHH